MDSWIKKKFNKAVWIVGHDIGGAVAQILAVNHPETVSRLTLSNSPISKSWPVLPVKIFKLIAQFGLFPIIAKAGLLPNPYTSTKMKTAFFDSDLISKEKIKRIFWTGKLLNEDGRVQFARHLKSLDNRQTKEITKKLSELTIPVQLLWAKNDYYQPWSTTGSKLNKLIPNSNYYLVEKAGHYLPLEKPAEFCEALLNWHDSL